MIVAMIRFIPRCGVFDASALSASCVIVTSLIPVVLAIEASLYFCCSALYVFSALSWRRLSSARRCAWPGSAASFGLIAARCCASCASCAESAWLIAFAADSCCVSCW